MEVKPWQSLNLTLSNSVSLSNMMPPRLCSLHQATRLSCVHDIHTQTIQVKTALPQDSNSNTLVTEGEKYGHHTLPLKVSSRRTVTPSRF